MSLSFLATTTTTTTTITNPIFHQRSSEAPAVIKTPNLIRKRSSYTLLCSGKQYDGDAVNDEGRGIDRRNVLVGLGGIYGATATFGNMAVAKPVQPPDLAQCHSANDPYLKDPVKCCPPYAGKGKTNTIKDFKLPDKSEPMRIRKSVQEMGHEDLILFNEAVRKMKELPKDDPSNFMQQAQIHCAYCNDAFGQVDFPKSNLQIHGSWLFLPWHRFYIYFWEKILGKLVGRTDLAIPYWDWDSKTGMKMPLIYKETMGSLNYLYNPNRNPDHIDALLDYKYINPNDTPKDPCNADPEPEDLSTYDVRTNNQKQLYDLIQNGKRNPELFLGKPIREGQVRDSPGSMELLHNTPHAWVGTLDVPFWDMGNFHTAARDTMFYGHHANIDRLWNIYREQAGRTPKTGRFYGDFKSNDWLDASFIFTDEENQLVKCKVRQCIDTSQLKYSYTNMTPEWLNIRQEYRDYRKQATLKKAGQEEMSEVNEFGTQPRVLYRTIRALVKRPRASLTVDDKKEETEVIVIDDFELQDSTRPARFDVYIAKPDEGIVSSDLGEYVGGYVYIPHSTDRTTHQADLQIGITGIVEDIGADASEELVVSIVPRGGLFTIPGVSIQLLKHEIPSSEELGEESLD